MAINTPAQEFFGYALARALGGKTLEVHPIASTQTVTPATATLAECLAKKDTSSYTPGSAVYTAAGGYDASDARWELPPLEFVLTSGTTTPLTFAQLFIIVKDGVNGDVLLYATDALTGSFSLPPATSYVDTLDLSLAGATA